ncbi:MAG TPA: penicillin-binding transpeptidase domain-containing protein [Bryobacteraceae bacterium]|nr:penicillin-binding transpeptidase domain-containing protein [Bryobacteraceae bacterium]
MLRTFLMALLLAGLVQNAALAASRSARARRVVHTRFDPAGDDNTDGDDLVIRRAAVAALGSRNGSVVVVDPTTGRVLTIVNQKLALESGFVPCSTVKLVTTLAALTENVTQPDTVIAIGRRARYTLTTALAHSNNEYFAYLGEHLGFDRVIHYASMLGFGEKAGLDITGEEAGTLPDRPPAGGGVGLMTSFGEGISMTPLELAALLSAIANGGTLYYLQYPHSPDEENNFAPKIKRTLDLAPGSIGDLKAGMRAAVTYGTARRAHYDPEEPVLGKTGTCTDHRSSSHMGWFGSFNEVGAHQLVIVVMLAGGRLPVSGPIAAGVAGVIYRSLSKQQYFASGESSPRRSDLPQILVTKPTCCEQ